MLFLFPFTYIYYIYIFPGNYVTAHNCAQEIVATRAGLAEMVSVGLLASSEDDLDALDDLEKMLNPPRRG